MVTIVYEKLGRSRVGENLEVEPRNFQGSPDIFYLRAGDVEIIYEAVGLWSKTELFRWWPLAEI